MTPPRLDFSLRVEIPSPLQGAPRAPGQSPLRRVRWHGLLRGLRSSGWQAGSMSCEGRAGAMEN